MSFDKSFCASPWFHMRINNSGTYEYCRWKKQSSGSRLDVDNNIKNKTPDEYFQKDLSTIRQQLLNGEIPAECVECYTMEQHGKVSGRQRQLLKVGVIPIYFEKTLASSTLKNDFDYSNLNQGNTLRKVSDWQIDLGNYCNSGCIFCHPGSSSRLATEFLQLKLISQSPPPNWCDDPELLNRFINDLTSNNNLKYLHFIGGETLITPAFRTILQALVDSGQASTVTIGFTTNLTTWSESMNDLLTKFDQVNLGLSIETLTAINDYVRWPSKQQQTKDLLDRWVALGKKQNWLIQLRITPTCLTIHDLWTIYEYAWQNHLAVESCNFLYQPEYLRINVLPLDYLKQARSILAEWINKHELITSDQIINTRNPTLAQSQVIQDAQSYLNYIDNVDDETFRLSDLVQYLKVLENNRGNSILDYLPQYETLFRSAGY